MQRYCALALTILGRLAVNTLTRFAIHPISAVCLAVVGICFTATVSLAFCPAPSSPDYRAAAEAQFKCSSERKPENLPTGEREFQVKLDFPGDLPLPTDLPWKDIDFQSEPEKYIRALLAYGLKDNTASQIDWRIENNTASRWCHAPWFHNQRERIHGMTAERSSRPKELHELQVTSARNWAIGFYNDIGCYALGKIWRDPTFPRTKDLSFPEGTYAIKLIFTTASLREVPYLTGSKEWNAAIGSNDRTDDGTVVKMRLLQVDVAVRDSDANAYTGWLFGTFMYDAYAPGETVWEKLVPVGLMWGNDPDLTTVLYEERGRVSQQGWLNPAVAAKFFYLPRHNLGLHGRVNGPIDNPKSACLACHGRALDWGRGVEPNTPVAEEAGLLRPFAPNPYDDGAVKNFFRNLKSHEPFVEGTQSLDYSLQTSDGLMRFRTWVVKNFSAEEKSTSDVPPYRFRVEQPSAGVTEYFRQLERKAAPPIPSNGGLGRGGE